MHNSLIQKINTPLIRLMGVLFFMLLINVCAYVLNVLGIVIFLLINFFHPGLSLKKIFTNWYRFRYLLISICVFNWYFSTHELSVVYDKVFLLMAMLALVNSYLQLEKRANIVQAISGLLKPLAVFGVNTTMLANLISQTLTAVDEFQTQTTQQEQIIQQEQASDLEKVTLRQGFIQRLAEKIHSIEESVLQKQS